MTAGRRRNRAVPDLPIRLGTELKEYSLARPKITCHMMSSVDGRLLAERWTPLAVAIDPSGRLHYGTDEAGGDHIITLLGEHVPDDYLAELRADGVSYLLAGPGDSDLAGALSTLGEVFGIDTLLLEGGGRINGAFLKAGLIDELSIIVCPVIDGLSGVPSIFDYVGSPDEQPANGQTLRHIATETLDGGFVWLRYRVERTGSPASGTTMAGDAQVQR